MFPPDATQCLKQLKVFNPPKKKEASPPPDLPHTPTKSLHVEIHINTWNEKFTKEDIMSSGSKPQWESFVKGTKQVLVQTQLQEHELHIHQLRRVEEQENKANSRKVL